MEEERPNAVEMEEKADAKETEAIEAQGGRDLAQETEFQNTLCRVQPVFSLLEG